MPTHAVPETTLRDAYRALVRHRGKALAFFIVTMAATVLATLLMPRAYLSESKLFVRLGRENATLDPTVTLGSNPVVITPAAREDEMNSVAAMLASRTMLERVVDAVGPEVVLANVGQTSPLQTPEAETPSGTTSEKASSSFLRTIDVMRRALLGPDLPPRDQAIRRLSRQLKVEPVRKSNIVTVAYDAPTPELAQQVVASLVDAYLEEHSRLNRVPGSHRFFVEQAKRLGSELAELEAELAERKTTSGLASIEDQRNQMINRAGRLEDELLEAESMRAEAEAKVRAMRATMAELPRESVSASTAGVNDTGTDGIRQQFFTLQLQEKQAAAIYTDSHPKLQTIREELAAAQQIHDREERTRVEVTTSPDGIYEQTRATLVAEEPILHSLTAKTEILNRQSADVRSQLNSLNTEELALAKLEREIELREADYRKYSVNLEQARIDDALESQRMSNIGIVQPASYEARPIRPRALLNLALGVFIGVFGAIGIAFFAEYTDRSFRSVDDIERRLELPALVAIPRMSREAVRVNGRD